MATKIDRIFAALERTISRWGVGLILASVLLALAHIYVTPASGPINHGQGYAALSVEPFKFEEGRALQNRILTPLLAYFLLPAGRLHNFVFFIDVIGALFIALIYIAARKESLPPTSSALAAAVMTFSAPTLFFIHFAGYADVTSYLLVFIAMLAVRNNFVWPCLLALAMLNHENNIFSFPWFLFFYYLRNERKMLRTVGAALLMGVSLLPWYWYVEFVASYKAPMYSVSYYTGLNPIGMLGLIAANLYTGFFQAFKLFWAIPLYAVGVHLKKGNLAEVALYILVVVCVSTQLCFAHDTSRLLSASFPIIWLGFVTLAKSWETTFFQQIMSNLFVLNLFVPQYYVGQNNEMRFYSAPASWFLQKYFGIGTWKN